jgi:two-component system, LytTR family, response regulator
MRINCIAIEDEPLALKKLEEYIQQVEYLHLLRGFDNALDALSYLKSGERVDLIFLDIRMKKLSGIQFLESLQSKPKVIVTSAYDEYALKGYELDVADYLLKPFSFERFIVSVEKVYNNLITCQQATTDYIFVKTEYRMEKVELNSILFVQGMKDYLQIHTTDKKIMTLQTFKNLQGILPSTEFIWVHQSYLVSVSKIESIERNRIKIGNELIPISDGFKEAFYALLRLKNVLL